MYCSPTSNQSVYCFRLLVYEYKIKKNIRHDQIKKSFLPLELHCTLASVDINGLIVNSVLPYGWED